MRRQLIDYFIIKLGKGTYYTRAFESENIYLLTMSSKNVLQSREIKNFDMPKQMKVVRVMNKHPLR